MNLCARSGRSYRWLQCDSHVQRTMVISRLGTPPRSSLRAWAKRRRGGGAEVGPRQRGPCAEIWARGPGPHGPVELGRNGTEPKAVFKHGKGPAREPQLALAGRRQGRYRRQKSRGSCSRSGPLLVALTSGRAATPPRPQPAEEDVPAGAAAPGAETGSARPLTPSFAGRAPAASRLPVSKSV